MSAPSKPRRRRRAGVIALLIAAALAITFALGPRPEIVLEVETPPVPADPAALDAYLQEAEAALPDIRPGTDKIIAWADPAHKAQTEFSVVYLHGFSATRHELVPVPDQVAEALGANLFFTRLRGHGRSGPAMAEPKVRDWLEDGLEALAIGQRLGRRVIIIGTSTGGTLAVWLATRPEARDVHAFVLVSPNFRPKNPLARGLLWPWGKQLALLIQGPERSFEPTDERHAAYWTARYPTEALLTMMALVQVVEDLDLSTVTQPMLLIHSENDQVVDGPAAAAGFEAMGSAVKRRVTVEDSEDPANHVIAGEIMSPKTTPRVRDTILDFLSALP
ncbi:alpha/beta hydrolase [Haliangium sp.]|uniref:alpha/beta hydrolase n=1 Tax=Haliangium sp. TaxID=2663208 RepID=UPI003D132144